MRPLLRVEKVTSDDVDDAAHAQNGQEQTKTKRKKEEEEEEEEETTERRRIQIRRKTGVYVLHLL